MKTSSVGLVLGGTLWFSMACAAQWEPVGVIDRGNQSLYIDTQSLITRGEEVTVQTMTDLQTPQSVTANPSLSFRSQGQVYVIHCDTQQIAFGDYVLFDGPMGQGHEVGRSEPGTPPRVKAITPGTLSQNVADRVCGGGIFDAGTLVTPAALHAPVSSVAPVRGNVYGFLEKTSKGYRFTRVSFARPVAESTPWVDLDSKQPMFFTGTEVNCALGKAIAKVQVNARPCQSMDPRLFRAEHKSGSQRLTNTIGFLGTLGTAGSLRMTDIGFDRDAFEKAFNEADRHLPMAREQMMKAMQQANAQAAQLTGEFSAINQSSVKLSLRGTPDVSATWDPEDAASEPLSRFLDARLLSPLRENIRLAHAAVITEQNARLAAEKARQDAEVARMARERADAEAREAQAQADRDRRAALLAQIPAPKSIVTVAIAGSQKVLPLAEVTRRAQEGDALAQQELGRRLWNGEGIGENDPEAARWFTKAAMQGNSAALSRLGSMYLAGYGNLPKDEVLAEALIRRSAMAGDPLGQGTLGNLYLEGKGGLPMDSIQALAWLGKSANAGNAYGQYSLGYLYANGGVVARDLAQAAVWYRRAAEQGDAAAQNNLGVLYTNGTGVARDTEQAQFWLQKAADQGNATARENLRNLAINIARGYATGSTTTSSATARDPLAYPGGPNDPMKSQRDLQEQQERDRQERERQDEENRRRMNEGIDNFNRCGSSIIVNC